jgi:hypothetical protein
MAASATSPGLLFVWTNIDPAFETDFNNWYDREHVEERIAIKGFVVGTRYVSSRAPRKYLGLYRTDSLDVFRSAAYQQAFAHQTPWSVANFGRMRDTLRRVCAITSETGIGGGAWLSIIRLGRPGSDADLKTLADLAKAASGREGVITGHVLQPDPELSTPLPGEPAEGRVVDPILLIEGTSEAAVLDAGTRAAEALRIPTTEVATMQMMWRLHAAEIPARAI